MVCKMKNTKLPYLYKNNLFIQTNSWLLYILTLILLVLWFIPGRTILTPDEDRLWERVRRAEDFIYEWRVSNLMETASEYDPWKTGLIGLEWSPITTTLGSLPSKRTAGDPRWSIVAGRWFEKLGLSEGDKVAIYSSGSFPGMLLNVLCAAEQRNLEVFLAVSLGSSTWGANRPDLSWPEMESLLRKGGFISTVSFFYTLGGGGENGNGIPPEGLDILERAAEKAQVRIVKTNDLDEMIRLKLDLLTANKITVLVNIGGSASALGTDENILKLPGGLIRPSEKSNAGNGVIAGALSHNIPVIHFLSLKDLGERVGIPFDLEPRKMINKRESPFFSLTGIIVFLLAILKYKRWGKDDNLYG